MGAERVLVASGISLLFLNLGQLFETIEVFGGEFHPVNQRNIGANW
jgi:hypothetical protein